MEIQASDSNVADGMLHFVGIVVNQTTISFYKDSQLVRYFNSKHDLTFHAHRSQNPLDIRLYQGESPDSPLFISSTRIMPRPVTDCRGTTLRIGQEGVTLGNIMIYARQVSTIEMQEIMFNGFSLLDISIGKLPFTVTSKPLDALQVSVMHDVYL